MTRFEPLVRMSFLTLHPSESDNDVVVRGTCTYAPRAERLEVPAFILITHRAAAVHQQQLSSCRSTVVFVSYYKVQTNNKKKMIQASSFFCFLKFTDGKRRELFAAKKVDRSWGRLGTLARRSFFKIAILLHGASAAKKLLLHLSSRQGSKRSRREIKPASSAGPFKQENQPGNSNIHTENNPDRT